MTWIAIGIGLAIGALINAVRMRAAGRRRQEAIREDVRRRHEERRNFRAAAESLGKPGADVVSPARDVGSNDAVDPALAFKDGEVQRALAVSRPFKAIQRLRVLTGLTLVACKKVVEAHEPRFRPATEGRGTGSATGDSVVRGESGLQIPTRTRSPGRVAALVAATTVLLLVVAVLVGSWRYQHPTWGVQVTLRVEETASEAEAAEAARIVVRRLRACDLQVVEVTTRAGIIRLRVARVNPWEVEYLRKLMEQPGKMELFEVAGLEAERRFDDEGLIPDGYLAIAWNYATHRRQAVLVVANPVVTGANVTAAVAERDVERGWGVAASFDDQGARLLDCAARLNSSGGSLALAFDQRVFTKANVVAPTFGGRATLTGGFNKESAQSLAALLSNAPLPVSVTVTSFELFGSLP